MTHTDTESHDNDTQSHDTDTKSHDTKNRGHSQDTNGDTNARERQFHDWTDSTEAHSHNTDDRGTKLDKEQKQYQISFKCYPVIAT